MDPATVIALCKENIQPLRYGRNAAQLGTALRAEEDAEAQQRLNEEKQMFEDAIKNYEGNDPLENWYEYILWAEQSYPKSGHESPINRLLQQCLSTFEKEVKYHQDRRYIRLWINYISMQKNPLELYQLLFNNGIGTMVADMYRAWAFELEQIEDYKRADEVYLSGLSARAEPINELDYAHKNFQLAVARKTLGRKDAIQESSVTEQRLAFSSLRAIKAGKRVGSLRTGHRVRDYVPGVIPQSMSCAQVGQSNSKIQIYQDDMARDEKGTSILDHVPIEDTVHKENTLKPGPWSNNNKKGPLVVSNIKPSFKIHEDQDSFDMDKLKLFPNHVPFFDGRKYPEHSAIPVYVPDIQNPNVTLKCHYPKDLVYADNIDQSMEEIKASIYFKKRQNTNVEQKHQEVNRNMQPYDNRFQTSQPIYDNSYEIHRQQQSFERHNVIQKSENLPGETRHIDSANAGQYQNLNEQMIHKGLNNGNNQNMHDQRYNTGYSNVINRDNCDAQLERERQQRESEIEREKLIARQREFERLQAERMEAERIAAERIAAERIAAERIAAERIAAERIAAERIAAERMAAERLAAERIEAERNAARQIVGEFSPQPKIQYSDYIRPQPTASESTERLLGQSLTMNTKEAICEVQDLWRSPNASTSSIQYRSPPSPKVPDNRNKFPFNIHLDGSMTQHVMSTSKHHSGYNMQAYHGQENQQNYQPVYSTNPHQSIYEDHNLQNTYHYQMQQHLNQQAQIPHSNHPGHMMESHQQISHHVSPHQQQQQQLHHHHQHHPHHDHHQLRPQNHVDHHSMHNQSMNHHSIEQQHYQYQQQHHSQQQMTMHHSVYNNSLPSDVGYQQYQPPLDTSQMQPIPQPKQLHYTPYTEANNEVPLNSYFNKPYRMPHELPFIKSPATNRRDLKYHEGTENKENAVSLEYNVPPVSNALKPTEESNAEVDESLGVCPLFNTNDTCYTEAFNVQLASSTPMTNHFRQSYRSKDPVQFPNENLPPENIPDVPNVEGDDKLSVILETTREYVSSSSGSSAHTRTTASGFTLTKDEIGSVKEHTQLSKKDPYNSTLHNTEHAYDQKIRAQIQALHAQSPRTVQRNVDEITTEIKNNCDLRKAINFNLNNEEISKQKVDSMDCEDIEPMEEVEEEEFKIPSRDINPFDRNLIAGLLRNLRFPQPRHAEGYVKLNSNLNKFVPSTTITLGNDAYDLDKCLGKGMYGTVFKGIDLQTGNVVALKMQRPGWVWEYYIAREIKARLTDSHMLRGFMDVTMAYVADNCSILVSEYSKYGTLLAVSNQIKISTGKPLSESLVMFFTIDMLKIVEHLHKCRIIHGDIKPDNFLVMRLPNEDVRPTIQLIDFGCSIDMTLLPENTTFKQIIKTEDFTCTEMKTGRPWTYQTDLYCLAATSYCLFFGNYMRVSQQGGRWCINAKIPRYAKKSAWEPFFNDLLNIESCEKMPSLSRLRNLMEEALSELPFDSPCRVFCNILNNR